MDLISHHSVAEVTMSFAILQISNSSATRNGLFDDTHITSA